MESLIFSIMGKQLEDTFLAGFSLELIIFLILILIYKYVLKDMAEKIKEMPNKKEMTQLITNAENNEIKHLEDVEIVLERLSSVLDKLDSSDKENKREINDISRSLAEVKLILNQFQGHMMYSKGQNNFGNKELK